MEAVNVKTHSWILAMLLLISSEACVAGHPEKIGLPSGWRALEPMDFKVDKCGLRASQRAVSSGDFDGDGLQDFAMIAINKSSLQAGLLAWISSRPPTTNWIVLSTEQDGCATMGIEALPAQVVRGLHCELSDDGCANGRYSEICAPDQVISYFRFGSSGSIFVWNPRLQTFDQVWTSE